MPRLTIQGVTMLLIDELTTYTRLQYQDAQARDYFLGEDKPKLANGHDRLLQDWTANIGALERIVRELDLDLAFVRTEVKRNLHSYRNFHYDLRDLVDSQEQLADLLPERR